jgi:hypothetical protein
VIECRQEDSELTFSGLLTLDVTLADRLYQLHVLLSSIAEADLTSGPSTRLLKNEMCSTRIGIMGYYAMSLVLGIVYPIHVCLQMRFYMLHFFAKVLEKHYSLYCT